MAILQLPNGGYIDAPTQATKSDVLKLQREQEPIKMPNGVVVYAPKGAKKSHLLGLAKQIKAPLSFEPTPEGEVTTPIPLTPEQLGAPSVHQQIFEPGVQAPKDVALALAGGLAAGTPPGAALTVPAFLAQALSAGIGGGAGRGAEAPEGERLQAFAEGVPEFAALEAAGLGLGMLPGAISKRAFPGLSKEGEGLVKFAEEKGFPLPIEEVQRKGAGQALSRLSAETLAGDFVRQGQAKRIAQAVNKEQGELATVTTADAAKDGSEFLAGILQKEIDEKDVAFETLNAAVGKETQVFAHSLDSVIESAKEIVLGGRGGSGKLQKFIKKSLEPSIGKPLTFDQYDNLRRQVKKLSRNSQDREAATHLLDAIDDDFARIGNTVGVDLNELVVKSSDQFKKLQDLKRIKGIEGFKTVKGNSEKWVELFLMPKNKGAIDIVREQSPEVYESIITSRLGQILNKHIRKDGGLIKSVDGKGLEKFLREEQGFLSELYGPEKMEAIHNFAKFVKAGEKSISKLSKDEKIFSVSSAFKGAEVGAFVTAPEILIPGEVGAFALAKKLTDPNSTTFKLFAGKSPQIIEGLLRSATPGAVQANLEGQTQLGPTIAEGQRRLAEKAKQFKPEEESLLSRILRFERLQ